MGPRRTETVSTRSAAAVGLMAAVLLAVAVAGGCSDRTADGDRADASGESGGVSTSGEGPSADVGGAGSTTTGEEFPPQWPPGECLFDGAFGDIRCLSALRSWCLFTTTEEECEGYEPYLFDGTGRYVSCGWVAVVPVVDVQSCEVGSISFRCEAAAGTWGPPPQTDPSCASTRTWSFGEGELVSMGTSTYLVGPLGPWNDYDNPEAPEPPYTSCWGTSAPDECTCVDVACLLADE